MQSTLTPLPTASSLPARINAAHESCCRATGQAIEYAMRCGDLLAQAKNECDHGAWQQWLSDNFSGSLRTARLYMQLAERREVIESKRQSVTVLTIPEARRLIAESKAPAPHDDLFGAELAPIIDAMLHGPFTPDDFTTIRGSWLESKILRKAKVPSTVQWAASCAIEYDLPLLRTVSGDDLYEALRIIVPFAKGEAGFAFAGVKHNHVVVVHLCSQRIAGALLLELDYREKVTDKQFDRDRSEALEKFSAAVDAQLAELEGAA